MQIAHHEHRILCPRNAVFFLAALVLSALLLGCGPVIETTARPRQFLPEDGASTGRISVLLDVSRLERMPETLEPARLKEVLEEELKFSGRFRDYRVAISDASPAGEPGRVDVAFTRLEYVKQMKRFPPGPPLGLGCLYPLVAPLLFERDYLKLEVTALADLLVYDGEGREAGKSYLAETAAGRADFFGSGESKAAAALQDIAYRNFSRQLIREFLFLTR